MRTGVARPAALSAAVMFMILAALPGYAQVTTNDAALSGLAPAAPAQAPAAPAAATPGQADDFEVPHPVRKPRHGTTKPAPVKTPVMPDAPPANPVIAPPPLVLPPREPPPPPAIPLRADAPGSFEKLNDLLRLHFAPGGAELNPGMMSAIVWVAAAMKAKPDLTVAVNAYAPGDAADPSTARRLSLSRALAVRAVLIHEGIAAERIYARAQGFVGIGSDAPDRADVILRGSGQ